MELLSVTPAKRVTTQAEQASIEQHAKQVATSRAISTSLQFLTTWFFSVHTIMRFWKHSPLVCSGYALSARPMPAGRRIVGLRTFHHGVTEVGSVRVCAQLARVQAAAQAVVKTSQTDDPPTPEQITEPPVRMHGGASSSAARQLPTASPLPPGSYPPVAAQAIAFPPDRTATTHPRPVPPQNMNDPLRQLQLDDSAKPQSPQPLLPPATPLQDVPNGGFPLQGDPRRHVGAETDAASGGGTGPRGVLVHHSRFRGSVIPEGSENGSALATPDSTPLGTPHGTPHDTPPASPLGAAGTEGTPMSPATAAALDAALVSRARTKTVPDQSLDLHDVQAAGGTTQMESLAVPAVDEDTREPPAPSPLDPSSATAASILPSPVQTSLSAPPLGLREPTVSWKSEAQAQEGFMAVDSPTRSLRTPSPGVGSMPGASAQCTPGYTPAYTPIYTPILTPGDTPGGSPRGLPHSGSAASGASFAAMAAAYAGQLAATGSSRAAAETAEAAAVAFAAERWRRQVMW